MLSNNWENFQELWVPKNGQKQPKIAQIGHNWMKSDCEENSNPPK